MEGETYKWNNGKNKTLMNLNNDHIQDLIKRYRKALSIYWAECGDTQKNIEESTDYEMAVSMMYDAISYQDHLMHAKLLYKEFNKKEANQG